MTDRPKYLYGTPGAEILHDDPATVWESEIVIFETLEPGREFTIHRWTVIPAANHLPTVESLLEHIAECSADNQGLDYSFDHFFQASHTPKAKALAGLLLAEIEAGVTYWSADKKDHEHRVTIGANLEPLLDGRPMYVPSRDKDRSDG